jgi:hypothetical protein
VASDPGDASDARRHRRPGAGDGPQTCTTADGRFAITRSADGRVEVLDVQHDQRRVVAEGASAYWLLPAAK